MRRMRNDQTETAGLDALSGGAAPAAGAWLLLKLLPGLTDHPLAGGPLSMPGRAAACSAAVQGSRLPFRP